MPFHSEVTILTSWIETPLPVDLSSLLIKGPEVVDAVLACVFFMNATLGFIRAETAIKGEASNGIFSTALDYSPWLSANIESIECHVVP